MAVSTITLDTVFSLETILSLGGPLATVASALSALDDALVLARSERDTRESLHDANPADADRASDRVMAEGMVDALVSARRKLRHLED